jgi:hypothetical protein
MATMRLDEIRERDKLHVAQHEAGHLAVALAQGYVARAYIWPLTPDDPLAQKTWGGQIQLGSRLGAEISVAGVLAENMASDDPMTIEDLCCQIQDEPDAMSATDLAGIPAHFRDLLKAVKAAEKLLRRHHEFWAWAVATLLEGEVITDGMASEMFREMEQHRSKRPRRRRAEPSKIAASTSTPA